MSNLFLGLLIVIIAAVLQGSFAVPMAYARKWTWENIWIIYSILGMIVFNVLFSLIVIPDLFTIYRSAASTILIILLFGIVWGVGVIGFGLGLTAVGLSLANAIMLGILLAMGTFVPMVVLHPS